jgi:hypothetical protein
MERAAGPVHKCPILNRQSGEKPRMDHGVTSFRCPKTNQRAPTGIEADVQV